MKGSYGHMDEHSASGRQNGYPCCPSRETRRWFRYNRRVFIMPFALFVIVYVYWNWNEADGSNFDYVKKPPSGDVKKPPSGDVEKPQSDNVKRHSYKIDPVQFVEVVTESDVIVQSKEGLKTTYKDTSSHTKPNDTVQIFPTFDFKDFAWTNSKDYFWNKFLEDRYKNERKQFPLKIIVLPHSHNDPGWGWTYEEYFNDKTHDILNNAVARLMEYPNMTFQWSEASFMDIWWTSASETQRSQLKQLIHEKRFEIVTGGWVMTDEAIVPLYSMIDQLIEGQHWYKYHLDVFPTSSWSVDPFGFGSTFPYLLKISGIDNMVILRIHYAWKKWMAENRHGDFYWVQRWDESKQFKVFCHQAFYTMYLIANSLGPHSEVCRKFDFVSDNKIGITDRDIEMMAKSFVEEAGRTASLFEHNVALPILGADFTFRYKKDWQNTYTNYMKLFEYINSRKDTFNTEVSFGTLSEYFKAVRERQADLPLMTGDFFPYSDTKPKSLQRTSYWSGFYSSRPFWKKLHRETEHSVRTAEILFTIANLISRDFPKERTSLAVNYSLLVKARQYLGLFAHHDASPGVSSGRVMTDYQRKLNLAVSNSLTVQLHALGKILNHLELDEIELAPLLRLSDRVQKFGDWYDPILDLKTRESVQIVLFNSLGWEREQFIKVKVNNPHIGVKDAKGNFIRSQLNPVIEFNPLRYEDSKISKTTYELVFIAKVPALTLPVIFTIKRLTEDSSDMAEKCTITSNIFDTTDNDEFFEKSGLPMDDVNGEDKLFFVESSHLKLGFSSLSGFLNVMENKDNMLDVNMTFGGYNSVPYNSGPYLFMTNDQVPMIKVPFLNQTKPEIVTIRGSVTSEVIVVHLPLHLSIRILHEGNEDNQNVVFIENQFDSKKVAGEFVMKFDTNIQSKSKVNDNNEVFYTDQSGYTFEKRVKVDAIGVEGNYYPITTTAFIQDEATGQRLSLIVDRSHGAASLSSGSLEVMIERRLLYDDNRGIGQGITDNRLTTSNYILKLEKVKVEQDKSQAATPTLAAHHQSQALNYPLSVFIITSSELFDASILTDFTFFDQDLPEDTVLLNLRTLPYFPADDANGTSVPSKKFSEACSTNALMMLYKLPYTHPEQENNPSDSAKLNNQMLFNSDTKFCKEIFPKTIERTDLSGLHRYSSIIANAKDSFEDLGSIECYPNEISSFVLGY